MAAVGLAALDRYSTRRPSAVSSLVWMWRPHRDHPPAAVAPRLLSPWACAGPSRLATPNVSSNARLQRGNRLLVVFDPRQRLFVLFDWLAQTPGFRNDALRRNQVEILLGYVVWSEPVHLCPFMHRSNRSHELCTAFNRGVPLQRTRRHRRDRSVPSRRPHLSTGWVVFPLHWRDAPGCRGLRHSRG